MYLFLESSSPRTMFHGTTSLNKKSIEANGLVINNQSYPSIGMRPNGGIVLGGVYIGSELTALTYARNQAKTHGGNPLLVKISFTPDENCAFDDDGIQQFVDKVKIFFEKERNVKTITCQLCKLAYGISEETTLSTLSEKSFFLIYNIVTEGYTTVEGWDFLSRDFGKLIPLIKKKPLFCNPYIKMRYCANIGFTGTTKITNIIVKDN